MRYINHCHYCAGSLEGAWMRDIRWKGHICHTCYGEGSRFDHWLARVLRRFRWILDWRRQLGGAQ